MLTVPAGRLGTTSLPSMANTRLPPEYSLSLFKATCIVFWEKSVWKLINFPCAWHLLINISSYLWPKVDSYSLTAIDPICPTNSSLVKSILRSSTSNYSSDTAVSYLRSAIDLNFISLSCVRCFREGIIVNDAWWLPFKFVMTLVTSSRLASRNPLFRISRPQDI